MQTTKTTATRHPQPSNKLWCSSSRGNCVHSGKLFRRVEVEVKSGFDVISCLGGALHPKHPEFSFRPVFAGQDKAKTNSRASRAALSWPLIWSKKCIACIPHFPLGARDESGSRKSCWKMWGWGCGSGEEQEASPGRHFGRECARACRS